MNSSALVLTRLAGATAVRRCITRSPSTPLLHRKYLSSSFSHFSLFTSTKRFYSSDPKKNDPSDANNTNSNSGEQQNKPIDQQNQQNNQQQEQTQEQKQQEQEKQEGQQEKKTEGQEEKKIEGQEEKKIDGREDKKIEGQEEKKIEGQEEKKIEGQEEKKIEGQEKQEGQEQKQEGQEKKEGQEEQKREELPPWFASLPIWKKILYPSLLISFVSLITSLIYQSTLRSALPYKTAMHVIRGVDEIEEAMGEIKEPRWYRFWEVLYGYTWEESGGYEGIAKFWIPIVGVTEHETGELNKKGEPVIYKTYTRGRAYAEAKKSGAGQREWDIVYLVVKSPLLDKFNHSSEFLGEEIEGRVTTPGNKGEMVIVDKHVRLGNEY